MAVKTVVSRQNKTFFKAGQKQ